MGKTGEGTVSRNKLNLTDKHQDNDNKKATKDLDVAKVTRNGPVSKESSIATKKRDREIPVLLSLSPVFLLLVWLAKVDEDDIDEGWTERWRSSFSLIFTVNRNFASC